VEPGTAPGSETTLGATPTTPSRRWADSNGSATTHDLRQCARCGEQNQYCHGHTPIIPNASLDLPPRLPLRAPVQPDGVARVNLNRAQATALATNLINALENHQDAAPVPPVRDYQEEFARVVAKGLGISATTAAKGLGLRSRRGRRGGQGRGNRPQPIPDNERPINTQPTQPRQVARRPSSPTPPGFEHNRGPAYIPFRIRTDTGGEMPARYIRAHLDCYGRSTVVSDLDGWGFVLNVRWRKLARAGLYWSPYNGAMDKHTRGECVSSTEREGRKGLYKVFQRKRDEVQGLYKVCTREDV
jgi:hypothetical protein